MNQFRYMLFGVCFNSDIALGLPEAPIREPHRFQLFAMSGPWPAAKAGPVAQEGGDDWVALRVYGNGSVEIEWKGWLSFWVDPHGRSVGYRVTETTYPTAFEAYVANFAISVCLLLQGEELLHSTVVCYRGAGLGFLGHSGAGKSTMATYLLGRGAELVTDDMLRVTEDQGSLYAELGQPRLKLFEEAALLHLPDSVKQGRWNPVSEKYLFDISDKCLGDMAVLTIVGTRRPLHALILLAPPRDHETAEITLRQLEGLELFQALTSSTMNHRLQTKDRLARQFAFATRLANKLPVYALHYPRRHDIFPEVVQVLEDTVLTQCQTT